MYVCIERSTFSLGVLHYKATLRFPANVLLLLALCGEAQLDKFVEDTLDVGPSESRAFDE